jgi:hypothetical protein
MRDPKPHFAPCIFSLGFWTVIVGAVANCGSDGDNAYRCSPSSVYSRSCIGDGRRDTTPADQPVRSCSADAYTYFDVYMALPSPEWTASTRSQIESCNLLIEDASGNRLISYVLPSGVLDDGTYYGCSPGNTSSHPGEVSYSSCGAKGSSLRFIFEALAGGEAIGGATATATCTQGGPTATGEIRVVLEADHF